MKFVFFTLKSTAIFKREDNSKNPYLAMNMDE